MAGAGGDSCFGEETGDGLGGLGATGEPQQSLLLVNLHGGRFGLWVVVTYDLNEASIARCPAVRQGTFFLLKSPVLKLQTKDACAGVAVVRMKGKFSEMSKGPDKLNQYN